jgi:tetratricopeptide (TPR) repeat protein
VACFVRALSGDFLIWDDEKLLVNNPHFRGITAVHLKWMFTTFLMGHYQPLTWMSFAANHAVGGMNPAGYHLTNVILHAANTVLLFGLILGLLGAGRRRGGRGRRPAAEVFAAGAGALLFGIHPLRVESVAWVTERRDVLSGFFLLLALLFYVRRARSEGARAGRFYAASLGCYVLSVMSKAWGMTLPVVLLAIDIYPLDRFRRGERGRRLLEKVPYAAVALATAAVAWTAQRSVGAMSGDLRDYSILQRGAQTAYGLVFYVWKTIAPVRLSPIYPLDKDFNPLGAVFILCAAVVAIVTAGAYFNRGRAPWALAAWATYAVIVSPVLGWAQSGPQIAADRYTYLASLPWSALVAGGLLRAAGGGVPLRRAVGAGMAIVLVVLGGLTLRQSRVWSDSFSLFDHAVRIDPGNALALNNRGKAKSLRGDVRGALDDYGASIKADPDLAQAFANRGYLLLTVGDRSGALRDFEAAIRLEPGVPKFYVNRAGLRGEAGDAAGALSDLEMALRLDPGFVEARLNRGLVLLNSGRMDEAARDLDAAIAISPGQVQAHLARGAVRQSRGDGRGALADFDTVLRLEPANLAARVGRAQALEIVGSGAEAERELLRVLSEAPANWPARPMVEQELGALRARGASRR